MLFPVLNVLTLSHMRIFALCRGAAWHYQSHRVSYRVFVLICSTHQCSVTTQPNSHMSRYLGNHWQGFLAGSSKCAVSMTYFLTFSISTHSLPASSYFLWFTFSLSCSLFRHPVALFWILSVSLTSVPFWFSFPLLFYFGILLFFSILFWMCISLVHVFLIISLFLIEFSGVYDFVTRCQL